MASKSSVAWKKSFTKDNLKKLFEEKVRTRPSVGLDWTTVDKLDKSLDAQIEIVLRKCDECSYKFTRYRELLISKGAKKPPRCISIPTMRDKLVFSALNEVLVSVLGKSVLTPMPQVVIEEVTDSIANTEFDAFIKIDIKSFYASINHARLWKTLRRRIRKKQIVSLIENAIQTPTISPNSLAGEVVRTTGLPEGLPISNTLANLYLQVMDEKFSEERTIYRYWRYVDDILILTKKEFCERIKEDVLNEITNLDLEAGNGKTSHGLISDGFEYLGYHLSKSCISVRKSSVVALERTIEDLFRQYRKSKGRNVKYLQWRLNLKITGFVFEEHKYGWLFFYSQIDDYGRLFHLDWFVKKMAKRYNVEKVKFKRFVRAYKEMRNALHTTRYIPNIDCMTLEEKRRIVCDVYGEYVRDSSDDLIEHRFRQLMKREAKDIQKDVQAFS